MSRRSEKNSPWRQRNLWARLWEPFWALPAAVASTSLALGLLVPAFDDLVGRPLPYVFQGGTESARSLLSTIAGATISLTGLVFSITIVVLQLASSQFTPRVLGTFLDSRVTQAALGVFTGSFLYALTVLRTVSSSESAPVPQTSVALAYLYVVGTVVAFVAFVNHITESVQVSQVMRRVRRDAVTAVHRTHPDDPDAEPSWVRPTRAASAALSSGDHTGYLTAVDQEGLVELARRLDVTIELDIGPGDHVVPHAIIGRSWGTARLPDDADAKVLKGLHLAEERDAGTDPSFGVRQLVDIAERALSPGINDPTTAVQAIDQLHVLLRAMAERADPPARLADEDGATRLVHRPRTFGTVLTEAVDELGWYGRESVRVPPRLEAMLADLTSAARAEHQEALAGARRVLERRRSEGSPGVGGG